MNNLRQTIVIFIIILIFGSGLAIYVWNLMQGKNLAEPPNFDLSAYDDMSAFDEIKDNLFVPVQEVDLPPVEIDEESAGIDEGFILEQGNIYFKKSFYLSTAGETNSLIASFLSDFDGFDGVNVENLEALNRVEVEFPSLDREEIIKELEQNESIQKVTVLEPPVWEIILAEGLYELATIDLLAPYNGVLIKSVFPQNEEYIARISINDLEISETVLDKLELEYSDVLTVVRP